MPANREEQPQKLEAGSDRRSAPPVEVGEVLAEKYRVGRLLGRGEMGMVFAATHLRLGEKRAIKFLLPALASDPETVERFAREARRAAGIRSTHVAQVFDVDQLPSGVPYMVMEYLEGEDLAAIVARTGPLPLARAAGYVLQTCEAVAEAHAKGIVHRDLKLENLFLARNERGHGSIKVLDFGISKALADAEQRETETSLTAVRSIVGSPAYMSPEQISASGAVDVRTDVWALGVILHELLAGYQPFVAENFGDLLVAIKTQPAPALRLGQRSAPKPLAELVARCLEKDPGRRPESVAEVAGVLSAFSPAQGRISTKRIQRTLLRAQRGGEPTSDAVTVRRPAPALEPPSFFSAETRRSPAETLADTVRRDLAVALEASPELERRPADAAGPGARVNTVVSHVVDAGAPALDPSETSSPAPRTGNAARPRRARTLAIGSLVMLAPLALVAGLRALRAGGVAGAPETLLPKTAPSVPKVPQSRTARAPSVVSPPAIASPSASLRPLPPLPPPQASRATPGTPPRAAPPAPAVATPRVHGSSASLRTRGAATSLSKPEPHAPPSAPDDIYTTLPARRPSP